ncbi:MAG TPA: hypothetical protein VI357_01995 [Mycobacteriales bacterium]
MRAAASGHIREDRPALRRYDLSVKDNLRVRRLHTQVIVIRRVAVAVVSWPRSPACS